MTRTSLHIPFNLILLAACMLSCTSSIETNSDTVPDSPAVNNSAEWLIPSDEVLDSGTGRDGIPAIDNPQFAPANKTTYVSDERMVVGIKIGDTIKAYPHEVLDYHEIVNDRIGETHYALTYCPLTGTAIAWKRNSDKEFGVSGLIFRNNLIPYDRSTGTQYSQMQMRGVHGPQSGSALTTIPVVQMPWSVWKSIYPESKILTTETGYNRDYNLDLYGKHYREEESSTLLFPVNNKDNRLPPKEVIHGVIWGTPANEDARVRAYEIDNFGPGISLITHNFAGGEINVVGSADKNFAVSFFTPLAQDTKLQFKAVDDALPVIMEDQEGNRWDLFGYAVEGPRQGERLRPTTSYTGYWFAWADFFPDLELYQQ